MLAYFKVKPEFLGSDWTEGERLVIRKYYLFFCFPGTFRQLSGVLSAIQLSTVLWVPWLLYNRLWVPAIILGANYFLSGWLSTLLNPQQFLHHSVARGGKEFSAEMSLVDSVCEKLVRRSQRSAS